MPRLSLVPSAGENGEKFGFRGDASKGISREGKRIGELANCMQELGWMELGGEDGVCFCLCSSLLL